MSYILLAHGLLGVKFILDFLKDCVRLLINNTLALKRLFLVAGTIAGMSLFLSVGVTAALLVLADSRAMFEGGDFNSFDDGEYDDFLIAIPPRDEDDDEGFLRPPARTNFLLIGLDLNVLADALMVGTFYRDSGDIHIMSIPRDMIARLPAHRMEYMSSHGLRPPNTLKINELRAYGGQLQGIYFVKAQLAEMLGVDFHYYVEVELSAFRRIVDAIGGVYMEIPRRLFYRDPTSNPPLLIDIPAGLQKLDGNMAEGVVRYRQWPMGDLQRNEMQMEFMSQLIKQAATREALLNDPMEIIRIVLEDVRTNAGLSAVRYIPFIPNVDIESVTTFTMPGHIGMVGPREFFIPDAERLHEVIGNIFYADVEA